MYGYLTIEECINLNSKGYSIIMDGDLKESIIKNSKLESRYEGKCSSYYKIIDNILNAFDSIYTLISGKIKQIFDNSNLHNEKM